MLNDESDRFYSVWNYFGSKGSYLLDQVILICSKKENYNEQDMQGVVYNLKKHIKEKVIKNQDDIKDQIKTLKTEQETTNAEIKYTNVKIDTLQKSQTELMTMMRQLLEEKK
jgi:hypothetical protein